MLDNTQWEMSVKFETWFKKFPQHFLHRFSFNSLQNSIYKINLIPSMLLSCQTVRFAVSSEGINNQQTKTIKWWILKWIYGKWRKLQQSVSNLSYCNFFFFFLHFLSIFPAVNLIGSLFMSAWIIHRYPPNRFGSPTSQQNDFSPFGYTPQGPGGINSQFGPVGFPGVNGQGFPGRFPAHGGSNENCIDYFFGTQ